MKKARPRMSTAKHNYVKTLDDTNRFEDGLSVLIAEYQNKKMVEMENSVLRRSLDMREGGDNRWKLWFKLLLAANVVFGFFLWQVW